MGYHIKIDGTSLCRYDDWTVTWLMSEWIDNGHRMDMAVQCSFGDEKKAERSAEFMRAMLPGKNVEVVSGECDQQE